MLRHAEGESRLAPVQEGSCPPGKLFTRSKRPSVQASQSQPLGGHNFATRRNTRWKKSLNMQETSIRDHFRKPRRLANYARKLWPNGQCPPKHRWNPSPDRRQVRRSNGGRHTRRFPAEFWKLAPRIEAARVVEKFPAGEVGCPPAPRGEAPQRAGAASSQDGPERHEGRHEGRVQSGLLPSRRRSRRHRGDRRRQEHVVPPASNIRPGIHANATRCHAIGVRDVEVLHTLVMTNEAAAVRTHLESILDATGVGRVRRSSP
mmetsp:Transcript_131770/g.357817  ORF Transcript_131770/g.357817 Transcript_131770/m.357817 type:complete len:261 (-) Transcript_131770:343-1125(-)